MKPITALLLLVNLIVNSVFGQSGSVSGYIQDAESLSPLTGAYIIIGGKKGDHSDIDGRFSIPAVSPGNYELLISHIGYKTEFVPLEVKPEMVSSVKINLRRAGLDLSEIRIHGRKNHFSETLHAVDIQLRPLQSSQDVLRQVPGLFIAQHAGGGKAEQIFLRGYDLDHGTDILITVDGMPVNMVSHAHGQGYADLHFLIPETIENTVFDKGPYTASKGNFATAAFVDYQTKSFPEKNILKIESGDFNMKRAVGMLTLFNKSANHSRQQLYVATEYMASDGYFKSPQDFHRFNWMGKYQSRFTSGSELSVTVMGFESSWNASGQIPDRAVRSGMISRFGAINNQEGGSTRRYSLNAKFGKRWKNNWRSENNFYFTNYYFNLYSDFTFFLEDERNGDMINQRENRNLFGYTSSSSKNWWLGNKKITSELGGGLRMDLVRNVELSRTPERKFLKALQQGDVNESNIFLHVSQDIQWDERLNTSLGLRYDYLRFGYKDKLAERPGFRFRGKAVLSPKIKITYALTPGIKLFFHHGTGFHSNDSRVTNETSATGLAPRVAGTDAGALFKPAKNLLIKTAVWHFLSEQEFVYVGDEGIVEPAGRSRRFGLDLSVRYQFTPWLFGDADWNLTRARSVEEEKGNNYIPLAPSMTSIAGLTVKLKSGFSGSLRYRFLDSRPANETNTSRTEGYMIYDLVAGYTIKSMSINLSIENLFNREWREAQFETTSKLRSEPHPVTEIHYTPGNPLFIKGGITLKF